MVTRRRFLKSLMAALAALAGAGFAMGAALAGPPTEDDYYELLTYPIPGDLKMEASGLAMLPDGRLAITIRKGEIWILDEPAKEYSSADEIKFTRFASGLHEPVGPEVVARLAERIAQWWPVTGRQVLTEWTSEPGQWR